MKKGFTMIELIFVIVILGILAAVAIPRLAATRDDAEVAKTLSNLSTLVSDVTSNYTAQNGFADNITGMTNVVGVESTDLKELNQAGAKTVSANFKVGKTENCVQISFMKNAAEQIDLYVGTEKLIELQKAITDAKGKLAENTEPAQEQTLKDAVAAAEKALQKSLEQEGALAPDGADTQCRTLTSAKSFKDIAGKPYKLSGSSVKF